MVKPILCIRKISHDLQVVEQIKTNQKGFSPTIVLATRLPDGQEAKYFSLWFPRLEGRGYGVIWVKPNYQL